MKTVIEYINEEYHWKDVKSTIQKEINTYSKEMISKMKSEIKDDIDDQDNAIFKNEKSKVWDLIKNCALDLKVSPEQLWDDCGGSHMFTDEL